ncbi:MAG: carbamoyl-phosphate synthase large subunit [Phycisphaerales bacterium]|nr:carbamoyl-phosphate synthase large subunit [Phycisphaerales bacterium]
MPKRDDIKCVLIISSGPIVIGQGCEFDYSGTQACKALREEGVRIVLLNSNPATIMTDPETADRTYIEPITPEAIDKILTRERELGTPIDSLLPTLGGQTGLNCAAKAADMGILDKHGVRLIGANRAAIHKAEDRTEFKNAMLHIGMDLPRSGIAHSLKEAHEVLKEVGLPVVIRPAYTLGGSGGGFANTLEEFETIAKRGLEYSLNSEILIEESCLGWKEYELEVMRDRADNVVIICSIENFDAMGVHTGDSITVAPAQTLSDKEYQLMRDAAIKIIREIGVETGGSNIQFAVHPDTGRMIVVEMNPRVSRSSALASKATGYPIARIAAKLALGYTLDEIPNDITKKTPASFEPTIDYCVVKIPRWTFEKFPEADETLTTQMKSVGEAMAIGRTFKEALQKGIRSMEIKRFGLGLDANDKWLNAVREGKIKSRQSQDAATATANNMDTGLTLKGRRSGEAPADTQEESATTWPIPLDVLRDKLERPCQGRLYYIRYAFKMGWTIEQIYELTKIDPWFLDNIKELVEFEQELTGSSEILGEANRLIGEVSDSSDRTCAALSGIANSKILVEADPYDILRYAREHRQLIKELEGAERSTERLFENIDKTLNLCDKLLLLLRRAKGWGYSDVQITKAWQCTPEDIRRFRTELRVAPAYKLVDTCAAEFEAYTPYYYSSYEVPHVRLGTENPRTGPSSPIAETTRAEARSSIACDDEIRISQKPKVIVLGGGPNRIGQGIEFDYCCVHAVMTARELGFETVMINSNPETVSTDYDTSDLLFFEPLTHEDVLNICERLNGKPFIPSRTSNPRQPEAQARDSQPAALARDQHATDQPPPGLVKGVIVQFGGQTPLNLAQGLKNAGVPILGTSPESIHLAEDREAFAAVLRDLGLRQPANGIAYDLPGAKKVAAEVGYPVLVRPSYVLGGRAMEKCHIEEDLVRYMTKALQATDRTVEAGKGHPILIDQFLSEAVEVDVDCISDGERAVVCGVMEHIEEAGIHSGDSACALPPYSLSRAIIDEIKHQTEQLAKRLNVRGLMNVQYAVKDDVVYVLEVNPRASRTVPFVSKATGVPWAKLATKVMLGQSLDHVLADRGLTDAPWPQHTSVKEAVFPFIKFPGVDCLLGPEMRSTGEVMGIDQSFPIAFAKSQMAAGVTLPTEGTVLISVNDHDKPLIVPIARKFAEMGFRIISTKRTREALLAEGIAVEPVSKIQDPTGPYLIDMIHAGEVHLLINTPIYWGSAAIESRIRSAAVMHNLPLVTTITGARAAVRAIEAMRSGDWNVRAIQDYHQT